MGLPISSLPLFVDQTSDRVVYNAFGLRSSLSGVWNHSALLLYADEGLSGRELPKGDREAGQDLNQLGGDFVLNHSCKVVAAHPSQHSQDRPIPEHFVYRCRRFRAEQRANGREDEVGEELVMKWAKCREEMEKRMKEEEEERGRKSW